MSQREGAREQSAFRWLLGAVAVGSGLALVAMFAMVVAVLGASFGCPGQGGEAVAVSGPAPSSAALQDIPPERLRLYRRAGTRSVALTSKPPPGGARRGFHFSPPGCGIPSGAECRRRTRLRAKIERLRLRQSIY